MKTKPRYLILTITILAVLLTGCSATESSSGSASNTNADNPDTNNQAEIVNVALESGSKPLSYEDEQGNKIGYEVDVLTAIDELLDDYDFNIQFVESDATQIGLETGKYALIGGGLYKTEEREEKYLIPDAVTGVSLINIYVHEDDDSITGLDDLVGKKLVPSTPNGGIYNLLLGYNEDHPDAQITITTAEGISVSDRFASVDSKEYDALVLPNNLGFEEIKEQLGLKVKAVEEPVQINGTYFALAKGEDALAQEVEDALIELRENGTLSELSIKWFGEDTIQYFED